MWSPSVSADVATEIAPATRVPPPSPVPPSLKVTLPVGVPYGPLSVAVNVTVCAGADGLTDDVSATVAGASSNATAPMSHVRVFELCLAMPR